MNPNSSAQLDTQAECVVQVRRRKTLQGTRIRFDSQAGDSAIIHDAPTVLSEFGLDTGHPYLSGR
jgi:hypothetical protein